MRLLQSDSRGGFTLTQTGAGDIPTYAILSHTWGEEEVTFRDMVNGSGNKKKGYKKIQFCGRQADRDGLEFFWVDTCCIDKSSSAELSESINSMFQWYKEAKICYVFLSDVQSRQHHSQFEKEFWQSRWFTRGWTLQELVAPRNVEFYNAQWEHIGSKLEHKLLISRITGIDIRVLEGADPAICNVAQRMSWASARNTTRVEDRAYSLLGLFHVNMPMIYGEKENAFIRLQEEIIKNSEDYSLFAWHDHEIDKGSSLKSIYRGVLAYSPANFCRLNCLHCVRPREWDYSELEYVPYDNMICQDSSSTSDGDPPTLSVRGLRLNLPACSAGGIDTDVMIYLYCRVGLHKARLCLKLSPDTLHQNYFKRKGLECIPSPSSKNFKLATVYLGSNMTEQLPSNDRATTGNSHTTKARLSDRTSAEALRLGNGSQTKMLMDLRNVRRLKNDEDSKREASAEVSQREANSEVSQRKPGPEDSKWEPASERLVQCAQEGNVEKVREALKAVRDVNEKYSGWTPLGKAAESGHMGIVRLLLANGAKLDITMDKGWGILPGGGTALHWAASNGHLAIVKLLVSEGADMDKFVPQSVWFKTGNTAVSAAAGNGHLDVVKFLLDAGADKTSQERIPGWNAFTWACEREQKEVVRYFIQERGFDVNRPNKDGMTPLHFAAAGGKYTMMEILLQQGASLMAKDNEGRTALHFAVGSGTLKAVSFLRKRGIDVRATDSKGKTALDLARKDSGDENKIVKYLRSESTEPEEEDPRCVTM